MAAEETRSVGSDPLTVLLVGCVSEKLPAPGPARYLYASTLFRLRRAYAESLRLPWYILGAKYGIVDPEEIIAPYDTRLSDLSAPESRAWGGKVFTQLEATVGALCGRTFEFHAGKSYVETVQPRLEAAGATVLWPLKGLRIGEQLHWYKEHLVRQGSRP